MMSDDCIYVDPKGMGQITKSKAVLLFTKYASEMTNHRT